MNNDSTTILLAHGSGGRQSRALVRDLFVRHFANAALEALGDAGLVELSDKRIAVTTDGYVVTPRFFPGGDIGKLAVCGTVNDLAVAGARPHTLTAGFIIEEGFALEELKRIVRSMAQAAAEAGVQIVAGDTKVVERGACAGCFITTAGVGERITAKPLAPARIRPDDAILINGPIADHGMAIMAARAELSFATPIESDCAALGALAARLLEAIPETRFMRDATRGGLAAVLCEACEEAPFGCAIEERAIPLREATAAACELLGIDPLHVANEGKLVAVVPGEEAEAALAAMRADSLGAEAAIIGHATERSPGRVELTTAIGTSRFIALPAGDLLPRIC